MQQLSLDFSNTKLFNEYKKYENLIHKLAKKKIFNSDCSNVCMDYEDVIQYGRSLVIEAIRDYNKRRGASLITFIYIKLDTKFANLAQMIKKRTELAREINFSNLAIEQENDRSETNLIENLCKETTDFSSIDFVLDLENFLKTLKPIEKKVFKLKFIERYTTKEITKKLKNLSENQIEVMTNILSSRFKKWYNEQV
jgi:RNA polymerase sigma factor (sigma-70 family)